METIADFYADRTVLITGATGFMGKVILEKLLRSCPSIKKIFVLSRPKRGQDIHDRFKEILQSKLFETVRANQPNFHTKVFPVKGDILEERLGLSEEDSASLIDEVSIIFHSAATVKFDEPLKLSVNMNVTGVKRVIELSLQVKHLDSIVHVSTAYANCDKKLVNESVYKPPVDPNRIIDAVSWMDEESLEVLTPKIIAPRPNTYTYTKAMAEYLLSTEGASLPCSIVRPSIVGATWQEPLPGWVDNFNGPSGIITGIGKGVLRIMLGSSTSTADLVPVDLASNMIIAAAWSTALERPTKIPVYNCTTGMTNRLTWGEMERHSYDSLMKNPLDSPLRLPRPKFTSWRASFYAQQWLDHYLPSWIMDVGLRIMGKRPFMMKIQDKIWKSVRSLEYFTSNHWDFMNGNVTQLFNKMSEEDQKEFNFDMRRIHWATYMENYCMGVKKYCLKEDLSKMSVARKQIARLVMLSRLVKIGLFLLFSKFLIGRVAVVRNLWYFLISAVLGIMRKIPGFAKSS